MNSLYITLFFNRVVGIVQTFSESWNQLLYPRVIEVCPQPFDPRHDFFLHLIIVVELFPALARSISHTQSNQKVTVPVFRYKQQKYAVQHNTLMSHNTALHVSVHTKHHQAYLITV